MAPSHRADLDTAPAESFLGFAVPEDGRILYFKRDRAAFRFLSHFYAARFELDGETWPTVEHFYQAQKSFDPEYRRAVRAAAHAATAKKLASRPGIARPDWSAVKLDIMRRADGAKYEQNPILAKLLRDTGSAELVEDSPFESFWGTGRSGEGSNWAGRVLMEVRAGLAR